jgi:hypothetical protein
MYSCIAISFENIRFAILPLHEYSCDGRKAGLNSESLSDARAFFLNRHRFDAFRHRFDAFRHRFDALTRRAFLDTVCSAAPSPKRTGAVD